LGKAGRRHPELLKNPAANQPQMGGALQPPDVYPESGCRLPLPERAELDPIRRRIYDSLVDPRGGTLRGLQGPGGIMLHSKGLARHSRPLNQYLRFESGLSGRVREIAILTTARALDSQFEWAAHEPAALREGVPPAVIDVIKHRRSTAGLDDVDAAVIELGREIFTARAVSAGTFARALRAFDRAALVDLVALMGNYAATAALLTAFAMQLDAGQAPPLPVDER
jgi:4-carboxymuconolactone decarboxylase